MKKNDVLEVVVEDVTYQGFGVAKIDGFPIFIENALTGEVLIIKIVKLLKKFGFGIIQEVIKESESRVPLVDQVGTRIGTMPLQHMAYEEQLRFKKQLVVEVFHKLMPLDGITINDTIGMENPWEYRNKAQVPVALVNGVLETGFYRKGSHDVIPVTQFHIQDPKIDEAIVIIRDLLRQYEISPYDEKTHKGIIRTIGVRRSKVLDQTMVILVCTTEQFKHKEALVEAIWNSVPGIVSLIINVNDEKTNVIMGSQNIVAKGESYYEDILMGKKYKISADYLLGKTDNPKYL